MSEKYLITEYLELNDNSDLLTEDEKLQVENGHYILAGVIQRCEAENGNGRVYPRSVLQREMKLYEKLVRENRAIGELDHPETSVVEMKNVSHLMTDIWWDNNEVYGKIKLLDTPAGNIAKGLCQGGVKFGISSRGLGSTFQKEGKTMVGEDFQLICFDLVTEPSTAGAFMLKEGRENFEQTKSDRINRALLEALAQIKTSEK
jgi:hypothetical protein